jgi:hypothetical protein
MSRSRSASGRSPRKAHEALTTASRVAARPRQRTASAALTTATARPSAFCALGVVLTVTDLSNFAPLMTRIIG